MKYLLSGYLLVLTTLTVQSQEKVYMSWIEVVNMSSDYSYATTRLFKTYVNSGSRYELVIPPEYDSILYLESFDESRKKAKEASIPYFMKGELNRVGELAIFSLFMYKTDSGEKIWSRMEKAYSPEDLDPVLEKLAGNIGISVDKTVDDIHQVTDYDSRALRRKDANGGFGILIGGGTTLIQDVTNSVPAGFGLVWQYDVRSAFFDITGELYFSDVDIMGITIHAWKPLSTKSNTFFVGGGLTYGGVIKTIEVQPGDYNYDPQEENAGLIFNAGGGYLLGRDANVSLRITGNLIIPTFEVDKSFPAGFLFNVGLLF